MMNTDVPKEIRQLANEDTQDNEGDDGLVFIAPTPIDNILDPDIQDALRRAKLKNNWEGVSSMAIDRTEQMTLPMAYCGEVTGQISGNVYCYGFAHDKGELIYLNMGGPRMATEAIRAKLSKGERISLARYDRAAIELRTTKSGELAGFTEYMSEVRFTSMLMVHRQVFNPDYENDNSAYVIEADVTQARLMVLQHIRGFVDIPVKTDWLGFLWQVGMDANLISEIASGGLKVYRVKKHHWETLISTALCEGFISLKGGENG